MKEIEAWEIVEVVAPEPHNAELKGRFGVVTAFGDEPGHRKIYGVMLEGAEMIESFFREELRGTGDVRKRSDYYDDSRVIRVVVDEKGRGYPKDST